METVGILDAVQVTYFHKFQILYDTQTVQVHSQGTWHFRRPQAAELVQGDLKFESTSAKTCGASARDVVPFQQQNVQSLLGQRGGSRQSTVACPDDDGIVFAHTFPLAEVCLEFLSKLGRCHLHDVRHYALRATFALRASFGLRPILRLRLSFTLRVTLALSGVIH